MLARTASSCSALGRSPAEDLPVVHLLAPEDAAALVEADLEVSVRLAQVLDLHVESAPLVLDSAVQPDDHESPRPRR